ncbi:hypothetical protein [Nocardia sputorum]|uniref:hypothetical protein n=1 Tax=Nocardia sputorum TaxID=2984338 RepID=UPI003313D160
MHPDYQGQGYARLFHDTLLSQRPERLAYLLVRVGNPARAASRRGLAGDRSRSALCRRADYGRDGPAVALSERT